MLLDVFAQRIASQAKRLSQLDPTRDQTLVELVHTRRAFDEPQVPVGFKRPHLPQAPRVSFMISSVPMRVAVRMGTVLVLDAQAQVEAVGNDGHVGPPFTVGYLPETESSADSISGRLPLKRNAALTCEGRRQALPE